MSSSPAESTHEPPAQPEHQRVLAETAFPDDHGLAQPATRRALAQALQQQDPRDYLRAVAALCGDRVLVPVVATAISTGTVPSNAGPLTSGLVTSDNVTSDNVTSDNVTSDKEAEMAVVLLQTADGRRAMLAFTGMDALTAWDAGSRPVPVTVDLAAKSAVADGAAALLIDFAGPHPLVIDGDILTALAAGHRLVELDDGQFGWAIPDPTAEPTPSPAGSE